MHDNLGYKGYKRKVRHFIIYYIRARFMAHGLVIVHWTIITELRCYCVLYYRLLNYEYIHGMGKVYVVYHDDV